MFKKASIFLEIIKKQGYLFVKFFVLALITLLTIIYYQSKVYDYKRGVLYKGTNFYNPYKNWKSSEKLKSNFHAHSKSWGGITNGGNSENEILEQYHKLNYHIASLSNYHSINKNTNLDLINIPTYEHGYNMSKSHFLAIDARECDFLDFPFIQDIDQKQQRLNNLSQKTSLVALAHPGLLNGFTKNDLKNLSGYQLFEVMSPYGSHFELWDYALSEGNYSWLLANDDTHSLEKQPAGSFFTLIGAKNISKQKSVEALKTGSHVAYKSKKGVADVFLDSISVDSNYVHYAFSGNIQSVFKVEEGVKTKIDNCGKIHKGEIKSYIRFEVEGRQSNVFTNPIFRKSSDNYYNLQGSQASENILSTFLHRFLVLIFGLSATIIILTGDLQRIFKNIGHRKIRVMKRQDYF